MTDNLSGVGAPMRIDAFNVLCDYEPASTAIRRLAAAARLHVAEHDRMLNDADAEKHDVLQAWRVFNGVLGAVLAEAEFALHRLERRVQATAGALGHHSAD